MELETKPKDSNPDGKIDEKAFENLIKCRIRPIGKLQWMIFFILIGPCGVPMILFPAFTTSINIPHRCKIPQLDGFSLTYEEVTNLTIPFKDDPNLAPMVGQSYQPCLQYNTSWLDDLIKLNISSYEELFNNRPSRKESQIVKCANGVLLDFSKPEYRGSVVETFDMVCERSYLAPLSNTIYMISQLIACLVIGHLADHFGRKPVIIVCGYILIISGFLVSFSFNVYMFYALRMIAGFCATSVPSVGFILLVELTDSKYRNLFYALLSVVFGFLFGSLFSAAAFLFQNWRWLHAFLGLLTTPGVLFPWVLVESPRWLFTMGRGEEAVAVIRKAIELNNKEGKLSESEEADLIAKMPVAHTGRVTFGQKLLDITNLFKTPEMLKRSLMAAFIFFSHGLVYYGSTFYSVKLHGNRYLMFWVMCLISIPANVFQFIIYHKFQRKKPLIILLLITIPIFVAVSIYQIVQTVESSILPIVIGNTLGKMIIDGTFNMIYVYFGELFPTEARSTALGTAKAFSKVGAALAPFIIRLSHDEWRPIPFIVFTLVTSVSVLVIFGLPETKNKPLLDTIEQIENHRLSKMAKKKENSKD